MPRLWWRGHREPTLAAGSLGLRGVLPCCPPTPEDAPTLQEVGLEAAQWCSRLPSQNQRLAAPGGTLNTRLENGFTRLHAPPWAAGISSEQTQRCSVRTPPRGGGSWGLLPGQGGGPPGRHLGPGGPCGLGTTTPAGETALVNCPCAHVLQRSRTPLATGSAVPGLLSLLMATIPAGICSPTLVLTLE